LNRPPCRAGEACVDLNIANVDAIANLIRTPDEDEEKSLKNKQVVRKKSRRWSNTLRTTLRSFTSKYFDEAELIMKAKPKTTPLIDKKRASGSNPSRLMIIVIMIP
jgi:hypothetical protein